MLANPKISATSTLSAITISSSSSSTLPTSPSLSPLESSTSSQSSTHEHSDHHNNTATIIGSIIGTVAVCILLIGALLFWLHRRKTHPGPASRKPASYELSTERARHEAARGSIAPWRRVTPAKEVWAHEAAIEIGRNSYMPPVELPAQTWAGDKKDTEIVEVHIRR